MLDAMKFVDRDSPLVGLLFFRAFEIMLPLLCTEKVEAR